MYIVLGLCGNLAKTCFFLLLIVASRLFMSEDNMRQNKVIVVLIKGKYQLSVDSLMLSQPPFCLADSSACGTCKATVNIYCWCCFWRGCRFRISVGVLETSFMESIICLLLFWIEDSTNLVISSADRVVILEQKWQRQKLKKNISELVQA